MAELSLSHDEASRSLDELLMIIGETDATAWKLLFGVDEIYKCKHRKHF